VDFGSSDRTSREDVPFEGPFDGPPNFPQNTQKWGVVMKFQAISEQRENIKKSSKLSDIFE